MFLQQANGLRVLPLKMGERDYIDMKKMMSGRRTLKHYPLALLKKE